MTSLFPLPFTPALGKELPVQVSLFVPFQSLVFMEILLDFQSPDIMEIS